MYFTLSFGDEDTHNPKLKTQLTSSTLGKGFGKYVPNSQGLVDGATRQLQGRHCFLYWAIIFLGEGGMLLAKHKKNIAKMF